MNIQKEKNAVGRSQRGWIYIDVLIGAVILAVAMTAILLAYSKATNSASYSKSYNQAVLLAQSQLETIYNNEPVSLEEMEMLKIPEQDIDGIHYTVEIESQHVDQAQYPTLYLCTVTVRWKEPTTASNEIEALMMKGYFKVE